MTVSLPEILREHSLTDRATLHTSAAGRVVSYDPVTCTVTVSPVVHDVILTKGDPEFAPFPNLPDVPVLWPGMGDVALTVPINPGDVGLILWTGLDHTQYEGNGQDWAPPSVARHAYGHAVFLPVRYEALVKPLAAAEATARQAGMILGYSGGTQVRVAPGAIDLGGGATDFVALASKVADALTALKNAIANAVPAPPSGVDNGAALQSTILAALADWPPSVASDLTKSK